MQNKPTAFEAINAGKGRLYPLDREKKLEKYNKLKTIRLVPRARQRAAGIEDSELRWMAKD